MQVVANKELTAEQKLHNPDSYRTCLHICKAQNPIDCSSATLLKPRRIAGHAHSPATKPCDRRGQKVLEFAHLKTLDQLSKTYPEINLALGNDYIFRPDIVIARWPEEDESINRPEKLVDSETAQKSSLRQSNNTIPILHASVSCKWTLRSDRAQDARTEALNLIRNRKGRVPHIVAVTAEPLPGRIASLALGTGDLDCVYHFALRELQETIASLAMEEQGKQMLTDLIQGRRLKDISDLPLDLAI